MIAHAEYVRLLAVSGLSAGFSNRVSHRGALLVVTAEKKLANTEPCSAVSRGIHAAGASE
jgi:hypothetical protein